MNSSAQWHARRPVSQSSATYLTRAARRGVISSSLPLVIIERQKQMFVYPLRTNMHINQEPPSGGTSLGALEGDINVILLAATMQRQPNPGVDSLVIMGRGVEVPEPNGIWSKPEPTFTQHGEVAERNDGV
jgi:hypothetical protein